MVALTTVSALLVSAIAGQGDPKAAYGHGLWQGFPHASPPRYIQCPRSAALGHEAFGERTATVAGSRFENSSRYDMDHVSQSRALRRCTGMHDSSAGLLEHDNGFSTGTEAG
jgi:hypothetical protein